VLVEYLQVIGADKGHEQEDHGGAPMIIMTFRARRATRSPGQAEPILRRLLDKSQNANTDVALWATYFGNRELAFDALEAINRNAPAVTFQNLWFPVLSDVRRLPGFKDLARKLGLVDYWRKSGTWGDFCRPVGDEDFECQ